MARVIYVYLPKEAVANRIQLAVRVLSSQQHATQIELKVPAYYRSGRFDANFLFSVYLSDYPITESMALEPRARDYVGKTGTRVEAQHEDTGELLLKKLAEYLL